MPLRTEGGLRPAHRPTYTEYHPKRSVRGLMAPEEAGLLRVHDKLCEESPEGAGKWLRVR